MKLTYTNGSYYMYLMSQQIPVLLNSIPLYAADVWLSESIPTPDNLLHHPLCSVYASHPSRYYAASILQVLAALPYGDTHSHVLKYTEVRRILLLMAWLLTSPTTLAYPPTHSTHSSITTTTTPSTTSYPYALTRVVRVMCTYVP